MNDGGAIGLVFDLPDEAWTAEIRRLRGVYDPARVQFPVEITIAGSSGLGWFSPSQSIDVIAAKVREIAQAATPFQCAFSRVEAFPQSCVYFLALKDEQPFHSFQRKLSASTLHFEPVAFSYKPHCTIAELSDDAAASAHAELAAFPVPRDGITISSVSLYSVNFSSNACRFVSRFLFGA